MIKIDRQRTKDGKPVHPGLAWAASSEEEANRAISEGAEHKIQENLYSSDTVRAALEELTHHKCAYCESPLAQTVWDVEHYRPKGRIRESTSHPGYYWLAYSWENLFPSCAYSNQNKREKPLFGGAKTSGTGGKWDQFPLLEEKHRWFDPKTRNNEEPLLIDPSREDPETIFGYLPDGTIFALRQDHRGDTSIDILRLNLVRLRRARRIALEVLKQFLELRANAEKRGETAVVDEVDQAILRLSSDERPYAGVTRFFAKHSSLLGIG